MRVLDHAVKWAAVLVALGFLYVFWLRRDVGKFQGVVTDGFIVDTTTGELHGCGVGASCIHIDPVRGAFDRQPAAKK